MPVLTGLAMCNLQDEVQQGRCGEVSWCLDLCQASLFFACPNRAFLKRSKSQDMLSVGFSSKLVSFWIGFAECWGSRSPSCLHLLLQPLPSCCAGFCEAGRLHRVSGKHGEFGEGGQHPPRQGTAEVSESKWRVPLGTKHSLRHWKWPSRRGRLALCLPRKVLNQSSSLHLAL